MGSQDRLLSDVQYRQRLLLSAMEGLKSGKAAFLNDRPVSSYLNQCARESFSPAMIAASVGALIACSRVRHKSAKAATLGMIGCAIGFGAAFVWKSRRLGASMARSAWEQLGRTSDQRWLERNPIDYA